MTLSNILNAIGLLFDIIGVLMLFKFGLPPDISRDGHIFITINKIDEEGKAKARRYERYSYVALAFLVIGFLLQLLSDFPVFNISIDNFKNCI